MVFFSKGLITNEIYAPEDEILQTLTEFYNFSIFSVRLKPGEDYYSVDSEVNPVGTYRLMRMHEIDLAHFCLPRHGVGHSYFFELSPSYAEDALVWFVPSPRQKPMISGLYSGFSNLVWALTIGSLVAFSLLFYLVHAVYNVKCDPFKPILRTIAYLTGQSNDCAFNNFLRVIEVFFLLYVLHITAFYESTLLMNLFYTPMSKPYRTAEEAFDSDLFVFVRSPGNKRSCNQTD